jgi:hypothetical protein
MTAVSNKTQKPLCVTLSGGKSLHLGPGKTGQISAKSVHDPQIKKLVDAGEIEVLDEDAQPTAGPAGGKRGRTFMYGHGSGGVSRRGGDR